MGKTAVVYWSMTGNTEAMAGAVAEGITGAGGEAELIAAADFSVEMLDRYDAFAFGCPAMGAEVLEESEFEPMFESIEGSLGGKKIALFGSYDWGDGEWMRSWEVRCLGDGAVLACDPVICNLEPDDEGIAQCRALGASLV